MKDMFYNLLQRRKPGSLKNRGSSFTHLFVILSVIGITFTVLFLTSLYMSTKNSVTANIKESKIITTNQIKNTFEREIQTIEKSFNAYSTTNDFYEMVQEPLGIRDFQKYRAINSQLNYFATFSLPGTVYSIVSLDQSWRIESGKLEQIDPEELQSFKEAYVENRPQNLYWIKKGDSILTVSLLPVFSQEKLAVGLAEIPNQSIQSLLEVSSATTPFFILNNNEETIFSANTTENDIVLSKETIADLRLLSETQMTGTLDRNQSDLIFTRSDYNNWLYITYLDQSEIDEALAITKYGLILLGAFLIFGCVVLSYFMAARITKPIQSLKNALHITGSPDTASNDWDYISQRIDHIVEEKQLLENIYDREKPELKKQFMLNLYRNRTREFELFQKVSRFDYPLLTGKSFSIMLIQIDDYGTREVVSNDLFLFGINQIVRELIPQQKRLTPIVLDDEFQTTLLVFDSDQVDQNKKQAMVYANAIIDALKTYMKLSVSIAFSPFYTDLLTSKVNLERSKEASMYHLLLEKQAIIFYDEIEAMVSIPEISEYPDALETELFQQIRLGEVEKVAILAPALLTNIMTSSNNPIHVQVALLRFALNVVQLSQTLNAVLFTQEYSGELYQVILNSHDLHKLTYFLTHHVIIPFAQEISEKTAQQFKGLSDQIITIIATEYDEDISLESIGDRLHYNPNYLSNIFKKEVGVTFSDYLSSFRFDIAKKWLRESSVTIKEISERLQYRNPQNFIRSFKKKENMTPGEYRKQHLAE